MKSVAVSQVPHPLRTAFFILGVLLMASFVFFTGTPRRPAATDSSVLIIQLVPLTLLFPSLHAALTR